MKDLYLLANPFIIGNKNLIFKAESPLDAANSAYKELSSKFSNNIDGFDFTLQKIKNKKQFGGGKISDYTHWRVNELRGFNNEKAVKFDINEIKLNSEDKKLITEFKTDFKGLIKEIKKEKLKGGFIEDLLNEEDDEKWMKDIYWDAKYKNRSPYWNVYYAPYLYNNHITTRYFSFPTFIHTVTPYIRILHKQPISLT